MRVLVIGGTRFIGRRIVTELAARGDEVLLLHRGETEPDGLPQCRHLHADRAHLGDVATDIQAFAPEGVIDTLAMTRADADATLPHLPDVPLVVLSSMDTYRAFGVFNAGGWGEPMPITEDSPVRDELYPHPEVRPDYDKLLVEPEYLKRGAAVLRLAMIYGEHDPQRREEFVLRRVRAGRTRIPIGPANWLWTKGYVGDVATATLSALDTPAARGEVFNVGEAHTGTFRDWVTEILDLAGHEAELVEVPPDALPDDLALTKAFAQHILVSSDKAQRVLGWRPKGGLAESVRWHLANPPANASTDFAEDDRALAAG